MRNVLALFLAAAAASGLSAAVQQDSWNKIRYVGGTLTIKAGSYDWDTTLSIGSNPATVKLAIAASSAFGHQQTVSLRASQITSLFKGPGAWQRVAAVPGSQLQSQPHGLFGLLNRSYPIVGKPYRFLAILYQDDDGKPGAILLDCDSSGRADASLARSLATLTGKPVIDAK